MNHIVLINSSESVECILGSDGVYMLTSNHGCMLSFANGCLIGSGDGCIVGSDEGNMLGSEDACSLVLNDAQILMIAESLALNDGQILNDGCKSHASQVLKVAVNLDSPMMVTYFVRMTAACQVLKMLKAWFWMMDRF